MDRKELALGWAWLGLLAVTSLLLLLSRKPDTFLNAQFWAEDGVVWYRQAYEVGWKSLLIPQNGYFQSVSKLTALLSLSVGLVHAPFVFNLVAAAFRLLPVLLLNSLRGRELVPDVRARLLVCFLYLAHPYSFEVFANVTNIHWHLALATLLLLHFKAWPGVCRKVFDVSLVVLSGLSGVFVLFLAPISAWCWYRSRSSRSLVLAALLVMMAAIQLGAILFTGSSTRSPALLDASWNDFLRIVGGQITAAGLLGGRWNELFQSTWWQEGFFLPFLLASLVIALFMRTLTQADQLLQGIIVLATMVFAAALLAPQISSTQAQWPLFTRPETGGRYAFIPIIAFYVSLLWMALKDRYIPLRWLARGALMVVLLVAIPASWHIRPYEDFDFRAHAARFEAAPPGSVVEIPINPPGWSFRLRKREE